MSSFELDQVQCACIGTTTINNPTRSISFMSLYQSQGHFGVVNSLELISLLNVT
jgi:hypothetical protein